MSERPEENKIKIDGEMTNFVIMQVTDLILSNLC